MQQAGITISQHIVRKSTSAAKRFQTYTVGLDIHIRWIANWPIWSVACCVTYKEESFTLEIAMYLWRRSP